MGYKLWAPFERLLSDDMNAYLSEQVPAIFTNAAARDLAIPAPILGQPAYLTGTRQLQRWNGSAWKTEGIAGGCAAMLESAANQSIANNTPTQITLATVVEDTHGFALGGSGLTIPAGLGGLYQIFAQIYWASQTTVVGFRNLEVKIGGSVSQLRAIQSQGTASVAAIQSAAGIIRLADLAVVSLWGSHTHGSSINSTTDTYAPRLSIARIGD